VIPLPDVDKAFEHENAFYLTCDTTRIAKALAHYEAFRMIGDLPGAIVECGVFKGASLVRFAAFRDLAGATATRPIVAFDTFGPFPDTANPEDVAPRRSFIDAAGTQSISTTQLREVLERKRCWHNVELVPGDIRTTVPAYCEHHPELRIALINLDTDILEPAETVLEHLYPRLVPGGVLLVDNYGVFPGETRAVDRLVAQERLRLRRFPFAATPTFIVKSDR